MHRGLTTAQLIRAALAEDLGSGDVTSCLVVPARLQGRGVLLSREPGVLSGIEVCARVFKTLDRRTGFRAVFHDGERFPKDVILAEVKGPLGSMLGAERTALNFLQRLSGIATLTRRFVDAVQGTGVSILDTRKTIPCWRKLEKYAVRCGGGKNHRLGLDDMVLIKDNHVAAAGSVKAALQRGRKSRLPLEVEVRNLAELRDALEAGVGLVMLDNMTLAQMRRSVQFARGRARFEASGRVNLRRVRRIAETGVDFISVGSLTHSAPALDISLEVEPV